MLKRYSTMSGDFYRLTWQRYFPVTSWTSYLTRDRHGFQVQVWTGFLCFTFRNCALLTLVIWSCSVPIVMPWTWVRPFQTVLIRCQQVWYAAGACAPPIPSNLVLLRRRVSVCNCGEISRMFDLTVSNVWRVKLQEMINRAVNSATYQPHSLISSHFYFWFAVLFKG